MKYITCKKCKKILFISLVFLLLIFSSKYNLVAWADNLVTVTQQPTAYSCGDGEKAVYSIKASGSGNSYQWQYSMDNGMTWQDSGDKGNKTETLTFTVKESFKGLLLRCVVTNGSTTVISDSAKLNVTEKVAVTQQPTAYSCGDGEKAVYSIKASGSGNSYQWQYSMDNGMTWQDSGDEGNKTETLTFTVKESFKGLLLRCVVTNGSTTVISDSAKLNVTEKVAVTQQPTAYSCGDGEKAVYSIKASGSGNSYQWQYSMDNGMTWQDSGDEGNKTETLTFTVKESFKGLLLRCVVTNGSTTVISDSAKLNVTEKVAVTQQPTAYSCGDGEKAVYSIKASGSGNSYQWQYSMDNGMTWQDSGDEGNKTETLTFTVKESFKGLLLRCVVTNGSTTVISDSAKLNVTEKVAVTQQPTAYSCGDGEKAVYSIKASGSGNSYQWQYSMDNGMTWQDSGDEGNKTETLTFTVKESFKGLLLRCVVTNGSTTVISDSAKLNVTEKVAVTQQPTAYSCGDGEKAVYSIKASGSGNSYQWQYSMDNGMTWQDSGDEGNKTETLTFTVKESFKGLLLRCVVTNGSTTVISDSAKLNVTEKVAVTQQPTAYSCGDGEKAVYSIKASGSGNSYQWQYSMDNGMTWQDSGDEGNKTETLTFTVKESFKGLLLRCVVTNGSTTVISDSAKLNIINKEDWELPIQ